MAARRRKLLRLQAPLLKGIVPGLMHALERVFQGHVAKQADVVDAERHGFSSLRLKSVRDPDCLYANNGII
jgi:hypothetical protein